MIKTFVYFQAVNKTVSCYKNYPMIELKNKYPKTYNRIKPYIFNCMAYDWETIIKEYGCVANCSFLVDWLIEKTGEDYNDGKYHKNLDKKLLEELLIYCEELLVTFTKATQNIDEMSDNLTKNEKNMIKKKKKAQNIIDILSTMVKKIDFLFDYAYIVVM